MSMVKNPAALEQFELELARRTPVDYRANLRIVEALLAEALHLGVMPRKDPLEGIDTIVRVARVVNSV